MSKESDLPYLSEVIDVSQFKKGQANIIIANCHGGKTTAAIKELVPLASEPSKVVYLIDTTAGKEALAKEPGFRRASREWLREIQQGPDDWWGDKLYSIGVRVMTYHQLGYVLEEEPDLMQSIDVVICDEMHNLINYWNMERSDRDENRDRPCERVLKELTRITRKTECVPLVVVMTATVNRVSVELDRRGVKAEYFDYRGKTHYDKTRETVYYGDLKEVLSNLGESERALVYVRSITQMKEWAETIDKSRRKVCCLWGLNNKDHEMSKEQLAVRDALLKQQRIPDDVDILFANAAYETSLNIKNEDFNTVIIQSNDPDVRTQVRGRIRHDIDKLYLYDKEHEHMADYFPEECYGKFLTAEEVRGVAERMNLKNNKGEPLRWPSIADALSQDGVSVAKVKQKGVRGWIIQRVA